MQINLVQNEIQEALVEYVGNQGFDCSGMHVSVTLIAGRGEKGHSAQIEILPKDAVTSNKSKKGKAGKETAEEDDDKPAIDFTFTEAEE